MNAAASMGVLAYSVKEMRFALFKDSLQIGALIRTRGASIAKSSAAGSAEPAPKKGVAEILALHQIERRAHFETIYALWLPELDPNFSTFATE